MALTQARMQEKKSVMDRLGPFPSIKGWLVKEWLENLKFWTEEDGYEDLRLNIFKSSLDKKQSVDWWRNLPAGARDTWEHAEPEILRRFIPTEEYQQELRMMWRGELLKQQMGESVRSFGEKIARVAAEMIAPPDDAEKILKFRTGLIATIRKRLTLGNYATLDEWIGAAELAEKDLLLESNGTTELTSGLLKDNNSGKHLLSYHEGLLENDTPIAGVLSIGITESKIEKPKSDERE